jgi:hypothetical protein
MNILSCFVSSNKLDLYLKGGSEEVYLEYPFYSSFQPFEDLEVLLKKVFQSLGLEIDKTLILISSSVGEFSIFNRVSQDLSSQIQKNSDFGYFYFDNLNLISSHNESVCSLNFTRRTDNLIANRSIYPVNIFNNDIEETAFFSKSLSNSYKCPYSKVVFGGDYFVNQEILSEYKMNFITNSLSSGFYEVFLDFKNSFPHFMNLKINTSDSPKSPTFTKFFYLLTSDQDIEVTLDNGTVYKLIDLKKKDLYFLHSDYKTKIKLKFKNRQIGKGDYELDPLFVGILIDNRSSQEKKSEIGVPGFKKLQEEIDRNNDYSNF